ncbi:MAG: hypothetical protein U0166_19865 [Acidobacteriota bacterium]
MALILLSTRAVDRSRRGVSLIELLGSLLVMGLLVACALPALAALSRRAATRGAASELCGALSIARSLASAESVRCGVVFLRRPDRYAVFRDDDGDGEASAGEIVRGPTRLPPGVEFGRASGLDPITFDRDRAIFRPDGCLDGRPGAVHLASTSRQARITVITNGRIRAD